MLVYNERLMRMFASTTDVELISVNIPFCLYGKFMLWKMWCYTLWSMGRTNHKFPVYSTQNVQAPLKSTVCLCMFCMYFVHCVCNRYVCLSVLSVCLSCSL